MKNMYVKHGRMCMHLCVHTCCVCVRVCVCGIFMHVHGCACAYVCECMSVVYSCICAYVYSVSIEEEIIHFLVLH